MVLLFAWREGGEPLSLQDHTDKVECVVFSPDSRLIASGARDGKARIHLADGRLLRTYSGLGEGGKANEDLTRKSGAVLSLVWGGASIGLCAGDSLGAVSRLSLEGSQWRAVGASPSGPAYGLAALGGRVFVGGRGRVAPVSGGP